MEWPINMGVVNLLYFIDTIKVDIVIVVNLKNSSLYIDMDSSLALKVGMEDGI